MAKVERISRLKQKNISQSGEEISQNRKISAEVGKKSAKAEKYQQKNISQRGEEISQTTTNRNAETWLDSFCIK
ncbi:hypothetical protein [Niallia circulans]|uniref:hypothetical protein n=1 Tax=Niallia circulans TaxID=1397 RepID=UPI00155FC0E1|nr:hypothetical protein [Niallia circulans]NRG31916.1 hypothetical protein [Niallia circulans]